LTKPFKCFDKTYPEACYAGVITVILIFELSLSIQNYQIAHELIQSIDYGLYPKFQQVEVTYVAANETSQEIFFKLKNTGTWRSTIESVLVNDTEVSMIPSLPLTMGPHVDYVTIVFNYNGSWNDTVQVKILTDYSRADVYDNIEQSIDLQVASKNPIMNAYPSESESQTVYQLKHRWEILRKNSAKILILTPLIVGLGAFFAYRQLRKFQSLAFTITRLLRKRVS
jgi:hypothetical protein